MEHDRNDILDDAALERLFASARETAPLPSPDLLRRIEADAARLQPRAPGLRQTAAAPTGRGWFAGLFGRAALPAGLALAGVCGIWIGVTAGTAIDSYAVSPFDSAAGIQLLYDFPVLAGLLPEG